MISKDSVEHYTWGDGCDGWRLVDRAELSVIHERMPPGSSEARHYHERARQLFFVLSGTATLEVDGVRVTFPDGWGLIRASNTGPILVLRYEAQTQDRLSEIARLIEGVVEKAKQQVGV